MSTFPIPVQAPKTTYRARPLAERLGTKALSRINTSYWETWDSRLIRPMLNQVCFGSALWSHTQSIRYLVPSPDSTITAEHLRFWVRFMRHVLPSDLPWSARLVDVPMRNERCSDTVCPSVPALYVRLHRMAVNAKTSLVYCSLIRYPKQWAPMVVALYKARESCPTPESMFTLFQTMHLAQAPYTDFRYVQDSHTPIMNRRPSVWSGFTDHQLSDEKPVTLAQFHAACRSGKATSAAAHFRSDLSPGDPNQRIPLRPILTVAEGTKKCASMTPKPVYGVFGAMPPPMVVQQAVVHVAQAVAAATTEGRPAANATPVAGNPLPVDTAAVASLW